LEPHRALRSDRALSAAGKDGRPVTLTLIETLYPGPCKAELDKPEDKD
jgi:hypothetical protein